MTAQAYPLEWPAGWPRTPAAKQGRSRFTTTFDRARRNLVDELRMLGARGVVLSTNIPLRQDGLPYSDLGRRKIEDPGAAVYFVLRDRPLVMARDVYWTPWENVHSLGLAIGHLRGLERHGGATMMERAFAGFTALPAPRSCWDVLGIPSGSSRELVEQAYRDWAKICHPDRGGSHAQMADLNAARDRALAEIGR